MKPLWNSIRAPRARGGRWAVAISCALALLLGVTLGIFAKWLDNLSLNEAIWWHRCLGALDLRNVFSDLPVWLVLALALSVYSGTPLRAALRVFFFFVGMCSSYHIWTVLFSGFDPGRYMWIWYGLTLLSPALAFVCWYGRGTSAASIALDAGILAVLLCLCFSIGPWYVFLRSGVNTFLFLVSAAMLFVSPKQMALSLLGAILLAFGLRLVF